MPELPEVEVVRAGIERWASYQTITSVDVLDTRSLKRFEDGPEQFQQQLSGARLKIPHRRGKYLWIPFQKGHLDTHALVIHLGMSGQVLMNAQDVPHEKHLKIVLGFLNADVQLRFIDQRIFGGMYIDRLVPSGDPPEEYIPESVHHIGRDPLDPYFSLENVFRTLRKKRSNLKRALLDQSISSGIGNIYADEALWEAKLHYARPTETLTRREVSRVYSAAQYVMTAALAQGGTSFDALYVNVDNEPGYFSRELKVYGREGQLCLRCRAEGRESTIRRDKFMNRSSYYCPICQRKPRRARL